MLKALVRPRRLIGKESQESPCNKEPRRVNHERMTVPKFAQKKGKERLAVLTAYDYPMARLFDEAGVDALLVGDTLAHVVQGKTNTLATTMDQMVYHTEMVSRAARRALVVADLPFLSYQADTAEAIRNSGRLLKEGGAQAVKLEGGQRCAAIVRAIVDAQIPVMGHIGLTPQSIHQMGGYRVQRGEAQLLADATALTEAGAFAIVLESLPMDVAQQITASIAIPTIGIGAGPHCDGQVLVWQDALGLTIDFAPRFVKRYAELYAIMDQAVREYCAEVRGGTFPEDRHGYQ